MALRSLEVSVSSYSFEISNIGWPQQPLTEKVLNFKMMLYDSKDFFSQSIKILNSRTWLTLNSIVVILQILKPLQPHWPKQALQPNFI